MTDRKTMYEYLLAALVNVQSPEECGALLEDLCTYAEIENMAQRIYSAKLILEGKTYVEVMEETQISSATLSRVSRCIKHGDGGYATIIKKTK